MNYVAKIGEREIRITIEANSGSSYEVTIDGVRKVVDARRVAPHLWSILDGNRSFEADVFELPDEEFEVRIDGGCHRFTLMNEQRRARFRAGGKGIAGKGTIVSPMPGKIVKLAVELGEEVEAGRGLIVIEAMKMENELKSAGAGRITEIFVKEGDVVESGAKLLLIE